MASKFGGIFLNSLKNNNLYRSDPNPLDLEERIGSLDQSMERSSSDEASSHLELVEVVYEELRRLAKARLDREYAPQTLQATALVHETWLRLGADEQPKWANRAQFFSAAAEAMRRILVDRARKRKAIRRGGGRQNISMDALNWERIDQETVESKDDLVIKLHESIQKLTITDPEIAELVKLHYFGGMKILQVAEILNLKRRTANRRLTYARAWLKREIEANVSN